MLCSHNLRGLFKFGLRHLGRLCIRFVGLPQLFDDTLVLGIRCHARGHNGSVACRGVIPASVMAAPIHARTNQRHTHQPKQQMAELGIQQPYQHFVHRNTEIYRSSES